AGQPPNRAVQHRPVQVGLGLEVPVQQDPADAGRRGDVIQAGGRDPGRGEGLGGGGQQLLAAPGPAKPPHRGGRHGLGRGLVGGWPGGWHASVPMLVLLTQEYTTPKVNSKIYNLEYTDRRMDRWITRSSRSRTWSRYSA